MDKQKIEISLTSIIKFFAVIIGIMFLYYIKDILVLIFVVLIITAAFDPMVNQAENAGFPRWLATSILYILIFALFGISIYLIFPPIITQIAHFASNFPDYLRSITPFYLQYSSYIDSWQNILNTFTNQLGRVTGSFYNATAAIFGGILSAITIMVLSFYMLIERKNVKQYVLVLFSKNEHQKEIVLGIIKKISFKMGAWLRGQVIVSLIIGVATFIILAILGNPYALTIGLFAALVEILPIIGPLIVAILAVVTTWAIGGWLSALIALVGFTLVQQIEAHFLIPKIMGKAVELSPIIIIIALLIGARLAGVPGAILAIPAAAGIAVFIQEYPRFLKK